MAQPATAIVTCLIVNDEIPRRAIFLCVSPGRQLKASRVGWAPRSGTRGATEDVGRYLSGARFPGIIGVIVVRLRPGHILADRAPP
jgi:hypothetical protein